MPRVKSVLSLLAFGFAFAAAQELPPNHPPIGAPSTRAPGNSSTLPPDHPPIDSAPQAAGGATPGTAMPEGHPSSGPVDPHELLRQLDAKQDDIRKRPKNFDIAFALGNLYYENARYPEAADFFAQAVVKAQAAFRIAAESKPKVKGAVPTASEAGCAGNPASSVEQRVERAEQFQKDGKNADALACALAAQAPADEALARRGTAFLLMGQVDDAMGQYEQALSHDPDQVEALYRLAAVLFDVYGNDVSKLKRTQELWGRFLKLAPNDRRAFSVRGRLKQVDEAIAKGGVSKAAPLPEELLETPPLASVPAESAPPMASAAPPPMASAAEGPGPISADMMEAIANTPRGPEFDQGLAKSLDDGETHLVKSEYQEAVQSFRSVLPYQPNNPRARAGMAAAMIGLGRPMADRIFAAALEQDPKSIDTLATKLRAGGNDKEARELWQRLLQQAPGFSASAGVADKLK